MVTGRENEPMRPTERAPSSSNPSLIAHRGFGGEHPENTAEAIRAARREADWIELDCRPTADRALAVFHDHRLDRCTPLTGPVSEIRSDDLFSTPVHGGGTVLSLPAALSLIPSEVGIVLDLKGRSGVTPGAHDERWDWIEDLVELLECVPNPVLASTFWKDALAAIDGRLPTAYLFERDIEAALAVAKRHGCRAIHPPTELIAGTPLAASDAPSNLLDRADDLGLAVNVWTVTTRYGAAALAAAGVDGLVSDYADVLTPRKIPSP